MDIFISPGLRRHIIQRFEHHHFPEVGRDSCCLLQQFCLSTNLPWKSPINGAASVPNAIFLMRWKGEVLRLWPGVPIHLYQARHQKPCRHLPQLLPIKPISVHGSFPRLGAQTTAVKWCCERRERPVRTEEESKVLRHLARRLPQGEKGTSETRCLTCQLGAVGP